MKGRDFRVHGELTNSDKVMRDAFWVGLYPGLTTDHIGYLVETIRAFARGR
jgi:CDP-6-deoxy-D-xylo-4-hexulose-3-dehydrase